MSSPQTLPCDFASFPTSGIDESPSFFGGMRDTLSAPMNHPTGRIPLTRWLMASALLILLQLLVDLDLSLAKEAPQSTAPAKSSTKKSAKKKAAAKKEAKPAAASAEDAALAA